MSKTEIQFAPVVLGKNGGDWIRVAPAGLVKEGGDWIRFAPAGLVGSGLLGATGTQFTTLPVRIQSLIT